jgi:hypothetical protein
MVMDWSCGGSTTLPDEPTACSFITSESDTAQRRMSDYEEIHMYRTKKRKKKKKKATYFKTYVATGILETMPIHPIINISHHQVYIAGETNPQDTTPR